MHILFTDAYLQCDVIYIPHTSRRGEFLLTKTQTFYISEFMALTFSYVCIRELLKCSSKVIIIIKGIYIAQVRKGHKCHSYYRSVKSGDVTATDNM